MSTAIPRSLTTGHRSVVRVPFIHAQWPNPDYASRKLVKRWRDFWTGMQEAKVNAATETSKNADGTDDIEELDTWSGRAIIPIVVANRIVRRANRLEAAHKQRSALSHLTDKELEKLQPVRNGVALMRISTEHQADQIAAAVHEEFPWMAAATDALWQAMRGSVRNGDLGFRHSPLLLDGPPGIGKSTWARFFAERIGLPSLAIDTSGEGSGFGIVGVQRGWGSAQAGQPVELILRECIGNPVAIIDEIEKTGTAFSTKGQAYSLTNSLLPLLERSTAKAWTCPYYRLSMDMSWISWILTSNNAELIPLPLRSRCREIRLPNLTTAELVDFTLRDGGRRGLSEDAIAGVVGALESVAASRVRPNLRVVTRLLELAERQVSRPRVH